MIFVTVGTQDKPFTRLLKKIDELVENKVIKDKVIVQAGHNKFSSNYMEVLEYISFDDFENYLDKADVIITHGGVGSILSGVKKGKTVIAVPRLEKYMEHINDHQLQIVKKMESEGYIIGCLDLDNLEACLEKAKTFKPKEFKSNTVEFTKSFKKNLNDILG